LDPDGTATSQCLVRWDGATWVAGLSSRRLGQSDFWRVALTLTGIDRKQVISQMFSGYGQFLGIEFDAAHQRLLVVDYGRSAIYAIPLLAKSLGKPILLVRNAWLSEAVAIVSRGDDVFVAARGRRAVVQVNLKTREVTTLVRDLSEPADVALTADGTRLLVVDAGQARVLEYDLREKTTRELVGSEYLREPRAVQVDRRGNLWVADAWQGAVLEFAPKGGAPLRRIPQKG
jgi:hypothetical protein